MSSIIKTVSCSPEMDLLIHKYKISPSEAFRVGLSIILADLGETKFINNLNIGRKIQRMVAMIEDLQSKLSLSEKHGMV